MKSIDIIRRLHRHRQWANEKLLNASAKLTDEQLHRTFEMGQGSIWKSLTHLFGAEYIWLGALKGDESPLTPGDIRGKLPGNQEADDRIKSIAQLSSMWQDLDQRWQSYLSNLSADSLTEAVYKNTSITGERVATQRGDILLHVCTHAHYHSAQVVNMLRHVGLEELPETMIISMAREQAAD